MSGGSALYTERTDEQLSGDEVVPVIAWATGADAEYEPRHAAAGRERFPRDLVSLILAGVVVLLIVALFTKAA